MKLAVKPVGQWRLGTRLALALGALALTVFVIVGWVMVTSMQTFLDRRLDDQIAISQQGAAKEVEYHLKVSKLPPDWFAVVYKVENGELRAQPGDQQPEDRAEFDAIARKALNGDTFETEYLRGDGKFRLRACEVRENEIVLVSAAPMNDRDGTISQLVTVGVIAFLAALVTLVVGGQALIRKGMQPLSDMADTAHDISSQDLTDSGDLAVRVDGRGGGVEVEELREAFNKMLAHIDSSLAARTAAEQRLRRFIADASHELRTPLTSLRGYADLFKYAAANEPGEREKHLEKLRSEAARMSVLLDDLLLLARLDSAESEPPLRQEELDLAVVAEAAADAFRAARPSHALEVDADTVLMTADATRLRQVLDNLLTNAAVHTPPGTAVRVRVTAENGSAVLRVSDTGPGIPEADQARIFDRFYRVDDSRTRQRGGSGLGLAVVQSLVHAHGGTIELTSRPSSTTFTIRLPRLVGNAGPPRSPQGNAGPPRSQN
ncbi:two-component system, OmpR family, sensor kinase [Lentzea xinjiangensis]|uniref:histidine kinase n=1 Tax=Lentzea xinjiangensis TaxID=402600 RepID=A0A1H9ERD8_9PSEU|nr:HAMP domain-containing sensor histidine kinase [Lentzea xinjiangensis]SEQ28261.1 two-component system, OmpR family, sensor kinase [Lentzea xinjiangensis]